MGSSGTLANIRRNAKFEYMTMPLPYYDDVADAPLNTAIGGASLWAMAGKTDEQNRCVASFFHFLSDPKVQAENHMRTGYLPVTQKAFEIAKESGYYEKNPGADVAVKQMLKVTEKSRGIRLGYTSRTSARSSTKSLKRSGRARPPRRTPSRPSCAAATNSSLASNA